MGFERQLQKPGEIDLTKGQRNQLMYISMFKDLCMFGIILILASLIVVNLDAGVGVFGVGKMVPLPLWLLRPHGVGLLDLVQDVLLNDMLLEVREHLCNTVLMYSMSAACGSGDWLRAWATRSTASLHWLSNCWSLTVGNFMRYK